MISLRKRLLTALVTLVGVYSLVFCLARFLPADPSLIHLGERGSNVDRGRWLRSRNLQRPLGEQFFSFPLGKENLSLFRREPVRTLVLRSLPQTLSLALFSWILALIPAALLLPLPKMGETTVLLSTPFPPLVSGSILFLAVFTLPHSGDRPLPEPVQRLEEEPATGTKPPLPPRSGEDRFTSKENPPPPVSAALARPADPGSPTGRRSSDRNDHHGDPLLATRPRISLGGSRQKKGLPSPRGSCALLGHRDGLAQLHRRPGPLPSRPPPQEEIL